MRKKFTRPFKVISLVSETIPGVYSITKDKEYTVIGTAPKLRYTIITDTGKKGFVPSRLFTIKKETLLKRIYERIKNAFRL